jgi:ferritin-like metal-binding protein YciE
VCVTTAATFHGVIRKKYDMSALRHMHSTADSKQASTGAQAQVQKTFGHQANLQKVFTNW